MGLGYNQVSPIEWVYNCPLSSILRAHTTTRKLYLKGVYDVTSLR